MSKENRVIHKTKIGGQALIEGIMMRGIDRSAMALRLPNGEIELEEWEIKNGKNPPWYRKTPIIRGCFNFVSSMTEGYKCLMKSADRAAEFDPEAEEMGKFDKWLTEKIGDKLMPIISGIAMVLGVALALFLFIFAPTKLTALLCDAVPALEPFKAVFEGVMKIAMLVLYMWATSLMKDIRRTYEYHGAEHKTIACYEAGDELTVENVRKNSRFHPRCGTSFILIVLIIGILLFMFLFNGVDNVWLRMLCRLATLPLVVGISYEFIKLAGKYDNVFTRILSAPGLWLQRITTKEPDDSQIEVALAAFLAVLPDDKEEDKW